MIMKNFFSIFALAIVLSSCLFLKVQPVVAKKTFGDARTFLQGTAGETGLKETDPVTVSGIVIQAALGIVGFVFFILVVYGGFTWMMARGNEETVTKARTTVSAAAIGLVIVVAAYAITFFVTELIQRGVRSGADASSPIGDFG